MIVFLRARTSPHAAVACAAAAALAWMMGARTCSGAPVLDQSHVLTQSVGARISTTQFTPGQSFTAGQSGLLSKVDLQIYRNATALGDATVEIWPTNGTVPSG